MFEPLAELMGAAVGHAVGDTVTGVDDDVTVGGVALSVQDARVERDGRGAQLPRAVAGRVSRRACARGAELMGSARPGWRRIGARLVMHLLTSGMKQGLSPPQARGS